MARAFCTVDIGDDGEFKVTAATRDVDNVPTNWDKGLSAWQAAGWDIEQVTGNSKHGYGWLMAYNPAVAPDKKPTKEAGSEG